MCGLIIVINNNQFLFTTTNCCPTTLKSNLQIPIDCLREYFKETKAASITTSFIQI